MLKQTNLEATSYIHPRRFVLTGSRLLRLHLKGLDKDEGLGCLRARLLTSPSAGGRICLRRVERWCLVSPPNRNSTAALHKFTSQPQRGLSAAVGGERAIRSLHSYDSAYGEFTQHITFAGRGVAERGGETRNPDAAPFKPTLHIVGVLVHFSCARAASSTQSETESPLHA
ncbi:hypothetical protein Zmor_000342 [Zophobas morio]|uniref:Uncharacterized protein n=1 Tax=Zophobas morio TaxID=2755281 RepID=A0AA38J5U7_9CUCU|nr:hypothetical protein Zmor_000342 [Zophobas morio]